jgi:hypothetical protein
MNGKLITHGSLFTGFGLEGSKQTDGSKWSKNWIEVATLLCGMDASPSSGLLESRHRKHRLEGLGNGIQWEIAYIFFELIKKLEANK